MQSFTLDIKRNKYIYIYYLLLYIVCLSWTNTGMVAPPSALRLLVTLAVFVPLVKYIWMAPVVMILFVGLRSNSVAPFGYIPRSWYIYEIIIILVTLVNRLLYKNKQLFKFTGKQIGVFIFLFLVDLINFQPFSPIFLFVLTLYLLYNSIRNSQELNLAMFSFVLLTITLSIYYFVFSQEFIESYFGAEIERAVWIDPNYFGVVLGGGVVIAGAYLFSSIKVKLNIAYKIIFIACMILGFIVIALQASRGAMLAVVSALIIQMLFSSAKWYSKFIFITLSVVGVIYLFQTETFTLLINRIQNDDGTGSGRGVIWISKLTEWSENILNYLGTGYRGSVVKFAPYNYDCHNEFVSILINYGLIGAIILLKNVFEILVKFKNKSFAWSMLAFLCCAFMTLSPITQQTGWTTCPFLILVLYKLGQLERRGEYR